MRIRVGIVSALALMLGACTGGSGPATDQSGRADDTGDAGVADGGGLPDASTEPEVPVTAKCRQMAEDHVRAVIKIDDGDVVAEEAQYSIEDEHGVKSRATIDVMAFGLNGDDSDTLKTYRVVLRRTAISSTCFDLESMTLIDEN